MPAFLAFVALLAVAGAVTPGAERASSVAAVYSALVGALPDDSGCPKDGFYSACSIGTASQCNGFESCCTYQPPLSWYGDTCTCPFNCIDCHGGVPYKVSC